MGCAGGEDARLLRTVPGTWPRGPRAARGAPPSRLAASLRPPVSGRGLGLLPHRSSRSFSSGPAGELHRLRSPGGWIPPREGHGHHLLIPGHTDRWGSRQDTGSPAAPAALGCGPGAGGTVTGERSARAQVPGARRRRRRRLPLLPPALPPPASLAPDRSPPPSALPAPPGARRAGLGLRRGAERSRREPGCGAHCVKRWASAGRRRRRQRAASPGPAGQAGQRRLRLRLLRLRRGRGGGGRGRAETGCH